MAIRSLRILRVDNFTFWYKKVRQKFAGKKKSRTFASLLKRKRGALSSVGSEHLPYKQRVGGSNPSAPTTDKETPYGCLLLFYVIVICFLDKFSLFYMCKPIK